MTGHALTPAQQAARWLARDDLDQSPAREAFDAWMAEHPDNRDAWSKANRMWESFDVAEENDLIAAMARAARQAGPEPVAGALWPKLIAASVALLVVAATLLAIRPGLFGRSDNDVLAAGAQSPTAGAVRYVTGAGQRSTLALTDGTRVVLDANSVLDVAFAGPRRDVRLLNGHAFFDVAHDVARPFTVRAAGRVVTALGTQFDVRLSSGALRVVLAEGRVSVGAEGSKAPSVTLTPGQAFAAQDGAAGQVATADVDGALAWKQGVVAFHDQPLSEAIALLNRETRAQIVIKDPKVAALRITGVFRTGDIRRFGRSVSQVLPVRMVARGADLYELVSTQR